MKSVKIKPTGTIIVQFPGNVEVTAVEHDGVLYLPAMSFPFLSVSGNPAMASAPVDTPAANAEATSSKTSATATASTEFTEEELMGKDVKELTKICKSLGVDPDEYDGKNTNKKLRSLILDAQQNGGSEKSDSSAKGEAPEVDSELVDEISEILTSFDSGSLNRKKTIAKIVDLGEDVDSDQVTAALDTFENDSDADIHDTAVVIAGIVSAAEEEETPKGKTPKSKAKDTFVSIDDLQKGDRVSVYWLDNKEWYPGVVASIRKGKVTIDYDDETSEPLDPENNTKIKLLEE